MDKPEIEALPTPEIHERMQAMREQIRQIQAERLVFHDVLTAREHAEAAAKRNPNAALDQTVVQK